MGYFAVPLTTVSLFGRNLWTETNYFRNNIYYFIYSMSPAPIPSDGENGYETFPFSDDENWPEGDTAGLERRDVPGTAERAVASGPSWPATSSATWI